MRNVLHAEWTKLRTVAAPWWLLLAAVAVTVAVGAAATAVMPCGPAGCGGDPVRFSLIGVMLGQAPIVVLAVLVMTGEYTGGMIRTTLVATPCRAAVLGAKAVALSGVVAVAATVAVLGSLLTGPAAAGGPAVRAGGGTVLYLILIALLSLGVAAVVRDSATSAGIVLGLLYILPVVAQAIGDPHWQLLLLRIGPMSAGLGIQATTDLHSLPLSPWAGLGVTAGWAVAALGAATLVLRHRDP